MISVEADRDGRLYCGRPGCHFLLRGLREIDDVMVDPSGWWDIIPSGQGEMTLLVWNAAASRHRRARRANLLPGEVVDQTSLVLPVVVECPRCKARQLIGVATPSP